MVCTRSRRSNIVRLAGVMATASLMSASPAATAQPTPAGDDVSDQYVWDSVPIGGGGYTTGIAFHPDVPDLVLCLTDVAGLLMRRPGDDAWTNTTALGATPGDGFMNGAAGAAFDPNDPDVFYAAVGGASRHVTPGMGIYRVTDQGRQWTRVHDEVLVNPNASHGEARKYGPSLAVDPRNSGVIYYVSQRGDGVLYTRQVPRSTRDWKQVPTGEVPANEDYRVDSRSVIIDPGGGVVGEGDAARSALVYVAVRQGEVYRTTDGGDHWSRLPDLPGASGVLWMSLGADGVLYVAHQQGIAKLQRGGSQWQDITPGEPRRGHAVSAHPTQRGWVLAVLRSDRFKHPSLWRSRDGGQTWENPDARAGDVPGHAWPLYAAPATVFFDPHHPGTAWLNDAFTIWRTRDVWASTIAWDGVKRGHEEVIFFDGLSVPRPGVRLIAGVSDSRGFIWEHDTADFGQQIPYAPEAPATTRTSFDFCPANPRVVWASGRGPTADGKYGASGKKNVLHVGGAYRSDDGGRTWRGFLPATGLPGGNEQAGSCKIAVSADDPDNAVVLHKNAGLIYTTDGGTTWQAARVEGGVRTGFLGADSAYDFRHVLASDRVLGGTFYAFRFEGGEFYRSTDGGRTFERVAPASDTLPTPLEHHGGQPANNTVIWGLTVAAAPDRPGEVWLSLAGSGVWRASGAGRGAERAADFEPVAYFAPQGPTALAFAPPMPGAVEPTLFVFGQRASDKRWGLYRSTDLGNTWSAITPASRPGNWPRTLVADYQQVGTIYVADASFGITAGRLQPAAPSDQQGQAPTD